MKRCDSRSIVGEFDTYQEDPRPSLFWALITGFAFWFCLVGLVLWVGIGSAIAEPAGAVPQIDPLVMKIYPDGTKVVVRWSEVGDQVDNGEKFGGAPRIVAYDPTSEGIVPIGEPSDKKTLSATNAAAPSTSSVIAPDSAPSLDPTLANKDDGLESTPQEGFYVGVQVGGAVVQNIDLNYSNGDSLALALNPGVRIDVPVGYRFNDWFSLEFSPGMIYNKMQDIEVPDSLAIGGYLLQVPMIVNAILTIPTDSPFEPFVGAGFGGVFSKISVSGLGSYEGEDQSGSSWACGYSALAGLSYHLDKNTSLGFVYKFTGTTGQNWSGYIFGTSTTVFTQSVEANATFRF